MRSRLDKCVDKFLLYPLGAYVEQKSRQLKELAELVDYEAETPDEQNLLLLFPVAQRKAEGKY